jgi:hypothetical protein
VRPALVRVDLDAARLRRYVAKPTGGFFTETFEILEPQDFNTDAPTVVERIRTGRLEGQALMDSAQEQA